MRILTALIIVVLSSFKPLMAYSNSQLKYRIQCATSSDDILASKFKEIPDLKTFMLPSGSKIFFSGGYFNKYLLAEKRLDEVRSAGFDKAFIRVFKYSSLLSKSVGDSYIEKVKNKILLNALNDTVSIEKNLVKVIPNASNRVYTKAEIIAIKKKIAERKSRKKAQTQNFDAKTKDERKKEEVIAEFDHIVKEPPVFKVFLGKYTHAGGEFKEFKQLKNEIIYTYKDRQETTYAVGFYRNEKEAQKDLPKYKKLVKEAKIVGLYKGMIVSLKLANELLEQFNVNNITR
tara:strand:+ start:5597 stop:6460 length:864 start_codon:yes stop_codon:yes gene_type:complete